MAEVNTGCSSNKFVFGENMEDRVVSPSEEAPESKSENGNAENQPAPLLRPSAFHSPSHSNATPSGILAPSRLGNPLRAGGFSSPLRGHVASNDYNSTLSHNPFANKFSVLAQDNEGFGQEASPQPKFMLRPSALDKQTANFKRENNPTYKSSFKLEPAKLQSPLVKKSEKGPEPEKSLGDTGDDPNQPPDGGTADGAQSEEVKQRLFGAGGATDTPADSEGAAGKKSEGASGFVFGQNMEGRVTSPESSKSDSAGHVFGENLSGQRDKEQTEDDTANSKDLKDINRENKNKMEPDAKAESLSKEEEDSNNGKTLAESAALHQAKQSRPELQEVEVKTGEENESNVFQVNAKLFVFEQATHTWLERGRGLLRLNDMCATDTLSFQSRLVMRIAGSLRLVLNTKIWPEMMIERASPKSIRVSAMDVEEGVKIYLIMANVKEADQIFSAIDSRVSQLRLHEGKDGEKEKSEDLRASNPAESGATNNQSEKRQNDAAAEDPAPASKKIRVDPEQRRDITTEESNDSSTVDPETEGDPASSNESFTSSPTVKSSSSET